MATVFVIVAILAWTAGLMAQVWGETVLQEIAGLIFWVIASVLFGTAAIVSRMGELAKLRPR